MGLAEKVGRNLREITAATGQGPAARRRVRRRYLFDALRYVVPYVAVDTPDGFMVLATADRTVSKAVFVSGQWQPERFLQAVELAEAHLGQPVLEGRTFVEVGANLGTTTLMAARRAARLVAFEPAPENGRLLRATLAANGLLDRVDMVAAAVSDRAGTGYLELSPVNSGAHRLALSGDAEVPLVRLDDALAGLGVPSDSVGMLWIDVEGHEASVLAGGPQLLAEAPPTVIELLPAELRGTEARLTELVESAFARVVDLRSGQDVTMGDAVDRYRDSATDLLLLPARSAVATQPAIASRNPA